MLFGIILRTGFEVATTYGYLVLNNFSQPLYWNTYLKHIKSNSSSAEVDLEELAWSAPQIIRAYYK